MAIVRGDLCRQRGSERSKKGGVLAAKAVETHQAKAVSFSHECSGTHRAETVSYHKQLAAGPEPSRQVLLGGQRDVANPVLLLRGCLTCWHPPSIAIGAPTKVRGGCSDPYWGAY